MSCFGEVITSIGASYGGRWAYGADGFHGSTTGDFYALLGGDHFCLPYDLYSALESQYQEEIDECFWVVVTGVPGTDDGCTTNDDCFSYCLDGNYHQVTCQDGISGKRCLPNAVGLDSPSCDNDTIISEPEQGSLTPVAMGAAGILGLLALAYLLLKRKKK